jgi:hypothetical protein
MFITLLGKNGLSRRYSIMLLVGYLAITETANGLLHT